MLIDEAGFVPGEDLIFGSDGMPHGAAAAVRQALSPPYPDRQALAIDELIAGEGKTGEPSPPSRPALQRGACPRTVSL